MRGYFGIGIVNTKTAVNVGTLWRSAFQLGAAFMFTIHRRYPKQAADTVQAWKHVPLYDYSSWDDFLSHRPTDCQLVAVEMGGKPLGGFCHPERAIYILGAEDHGIPDDILKKCQHHISLPSVRTEIFNMAVAGSIIMYDRLSKAIK
jgi:tRNA(Leu) C34 or U34 (ribose-2'-O)-methylase TrmL